MPHPPPRAYILPRRFKQRERLFSGLLDALSQGADPRKLEVEDGSGGWKPYVDPKPGADIADVSKVATPSRRRR